MKLKIQWAGIFLLTSACWWLLGGGSSFTSTLWICGALCLGILALVGGLLFWQNKLKSVTGIVWLAVLVGISLAVVGHFAFTVNVTDKKQQRVEKNIRTLAGPLIAQVLSTNSDSRVSGEFASSYQTKAMSNGSKWNSLDIALVSNTVTEATVVATMEQIAGGAVTARVLSVVLLRKGTTWTVNRVETLK